MGILEAVFWLSFAIVAYTYLGYPIWVAVAARWLGRDPNRGNVDLSISVIVAAHNEAHRIAERIDELAGQLERHGRRGEIIVVSDGSTDGTAAIAAEVERPNLRVIESEENVGKAAAISIAAEHATGDVLVFADVRQRWADDAIERLVACFADPEVGAVSGELIIERQPGVMGGLGLYWRHEKWLRRRESRIHSLVGVTGAIAAVRRQLFRPIPPGTILDDVWWPLDVVMQGYRVVHESAARAYDRLPVNPKGEFRRKVRTLAGNFQLMARMPRVLLPWRNPVWFQFWSHKALRLAVPWALLAMLFSSAIAPSLFYRILFAGQACFWLLSLVAIFAPRSSHTRITTSAGSFLVLNAAAWVAFWEWLFGRAERTWDKVDYKVPNQSCEAQQYEAVLEKQLQ